MPRMVYVDARPVECNIINEHGKIVKVTDKYGWPASRRKERPELKMTSDLLNQFFGYKNVVAIRYQEASSNRQGLSSDEKARAIYTPKTDHNGDDIGIEMPSGGRLGAKLWVTIRSEALVLEALKVAALPVIPTKTKVSHKRKVAAIAPIHVSVNTNAPAAAAASSSSVGLAVNTTAPVNKKESLDPVLVVDSPVSQASAATPKQEPQFADSDMAVVELLSRKFSQDPLKAEVVSPAVTAAAAAVASAQPKTQLQPKEQPNTKTDENEEPTAKKLKIDETLLKLRARAKDLEQRNALRQAAIAAQLRKNNEREAALDREKHELEAQIAAAEKQFQQDEQAIRTQRERELYLDSIGAPKDNAAL